MQTNDATATTRRTGAMRVIYLLLVFFVLTGIGATCRTTTLQALDDCGSATTTGCVAGTAEDAGG